MGNSHPSAVSGVFRLPFAEQIAFFRGKLKNLAPTAKWDDLLHSQHDRAFMVAGAAKADLLADLASAVGRAIENGTGLEEFRRSFSFIVQKHGWKEYTGDFGWRTRVILNTNANTSYAAGRLAQLQEFPLWVYRHNDSVLHPRPHHVALDGLTLPSNHHFWKTHYPPNGWGCHCYVVGAEDMDMARALGGGKTDLTPGWNMPDGEGRLPGIDKGWEYMPGGSVSDAVRTHAAKLAVFPAEIGAAFGKDIRPCITAAWPDWVEGVFYGTRHDSGPLGAFTFEEVAALEAIGEKPASAGVFIRPGLLKGPKADRHWGKGDGLNLEQWQKLAEEFGGKDKLWFLDTKTGQILAILGEGEKRVQLACRVNFRTGRQISNQVVSCYEVLFVNIKRREKGGELVRIYVAD